MGVQKERRIVEQGRPTIRHEQGRAWKHAHKNSTELLLPFDVCPDCCQFSSGFNGDHDICDIIEEVLLTL